VEKKGLNTPSNSPTEKVTDSFSLLYFFTLVSELPPLPELLDSELLDVSPLDPQDANILNPIRQQTAREIPLNKTFFLLFAVFDIVISPYIFYIYL
jgi:hypothetical protein